MIKIGPDPQMTEAEYAQHLQGLADTPPRGRFVLICQACAVGIHEAGVKQGGQWFHARCVRKEGA